MAPLIVYYYGSRIVANHEQGRVNLVKFSKEQRVNLNSRFLTLTSPRAGVFSRNIFGKIYCGALDKRKMIFLKNGGRGYSTSTVTTPRIFVSRRCNRRPRGPSASQ